MPAKRIILCGRVPFQPKTIYRYALWADVPAGNQTAYINPQATSVYTAISATELDALRSGAVVERAGTIPASAGTTLNTIEATLQTHWASFQNEITAETTWNDYGRYWNGTAWTAGPASPLISCGESNDLGIATFHVIGPVTAYAANRFQFVLYNGAAAGSAGLLVKVRLIAILPGLAAVTGVAPSAWTLRRREAPTTIPSGGIATIGRADSAQALESGISAHVNPTTAPAGGTTTEFTNYVPQADEQKLSTLDAPTASTLHGDWGGVVIYRAASLPTCRPITIRQGQTLELQQSATAGTGNCRIRCVFTTG